jgi:hypothetical protein
MKTKINDNKTVREESIKKLINSVLKIEVKSLMEIEKNILIEVLDNNKSFTELQLLNNLTNARQKIILENAVVRFSKYIERINDRQRLYEESQQELIELRHWKKLLEASLEKEKAIDPKLKKLLLLTIQQAGFSTRLQQICYNQNILIIADLVKYSKHKLSGLRNCGQKSITEVEGFFEKNGLVWSMKI